MNIAVMTSVFISATLTFTALCVLRIRKSGGTLSRKEIGGVLFQSTLFGLIVGFGVVPIVPPPPPLVLLPIALIEIVRTGLLLRFRFIPEGLRHYRLKSLMLQRQSLDKRIKALEALIETDRLRRGRESLA